MFWTQSRRGTEKVGGFPDCRYVLVREDSVSKDLRIGGAAMRFGWPCFPCSLLNLSTRQDGTEVRECKSRKNASMEDGRWRIGRRRQQVLPGNLAGNWRSLLDCADVAASRQSAAVRTRAEKFAAVCRHAATEKLFSRGFLLSARLLLPFRRGGDGPFVAVGLWPAVEPWRPARRIKPIAEA